MQSNLSLKRVSYYNIIDTCVGDDRPNTSQSPLSSIMIMTLRKRMKCIVQTRV